MANPERTSKVPVLSMGCTLMSRTSDYSTILNVFAVLYTNIYKYVVKWILVMCLCFYPSLPKLIQALKRAH